MATKPTLRNAIAVGKSMAADTLKRRRKAARTRQKALAQAKARVTRTVVASGPKSLIAKGPVAHVSAGVLIAEGDSWFDYPFADVLSELEDSHGFDVESVAHKGDNVEDMAYSGGQLDEFTRRVEKVLRSGATPRAILLSGGGNDVAGDEFAMLINHASSNIAGLNDAIVSGIIEERVRNAYATILSAITSICVEKLGHPVPIVVHGYDYPVPDGRGYSGGGGPLPGPWFEPGFRRKGYAEITVRKKICSDLIDRFNAMLESFAGKAPFAHVRYLDLRGTLPTDANYKTWWDNELHPTRKGFREVARKFAAIV